MAPGRAAQSLIRVPLSGTYSSQADHLAPLWTHTSATPTSRASLTRTGLRSPLAMVCPCRHIDENYEIDQIQVNRVIAGSSESHANLRKLGSARCVRRLREALAVDTRQKLPDFPRRPSLGLLRPEPDHISTRTRPLDRISREPRACWNEHAGVISRDH